MLIVWAKGAHHLPRSGIHQCSQGVSINAYGDLSTFDNDSLTRLVLLAHRESVRVEIASSGPRLVKIMCHKRVSDRSQDSYSRHPDLDELIEKATKMKTP